VVGIRHRVIGIEYINLINIINFTYYEFLLFKEELFSDDNLYQDSNLLFNVDITNQQPLTIEVTTFNKHNITPQSKPKNIPGE
jgi:hypothetical protein